MNKTLKKNGFSLIELLVVLGIIAVLTGLIAFNFNAARARARDVQRKNDLKELRSALELYKNDSGTYPSSANYATMISVLVAGDYAQSAFSDPKVALSGSSSWVEYTYAPSVSNTVYTISMCFENRADPLLAGSTSDCGASNDGRLYTYISQ